MSRFLRLEKREPSLSVLLHKCIKRCRSSAIHCDQRALTLISLAEIVIHSVLFVEPVIRMSSVTAVPLITTPEATSTERDVTVSLGMGPKGVSLNCRNKTCHGFVPFSLILPFNHESQPLRPFLIPRSSNQLQSYAPTKVVHCGEGGSERRESGGTNYISDDEWDVFLCFLFKWVLECISQGGRRFIMMRFGDDV